MKWSSWKELLGTESCPPEAELIISEALRKAVKQGDVSYHSRWMLIEYLCAEYLQN